MPFALQPLRLAAPVQIQPYLTEYLKQFTAETGLCAKSPGMSQHHNSQSAWPGRATHTAGLHVLVSRLRLRHRPQPCPWSCHGTCAPQYMRTRVLTGVLSEHLWSVYIASDKYAWRHVCMVCIVCMVTLLYGTGYEVLVDYFPFENVAPLILDTTVTTKGVSELVLTHPRRVLSPDAHVFMHSYVCVDQRGERTCFDSAHTQLACRHTLYLGPRALRLHKHASAQPAGPKRNSHAKAVRVPVCPALSGRTSDTYPSACVCVCVCLSMCVHFTAVRWLVCGPCCYSGLEPARQN